MHETRGGVLWAAGMSGFYSYDGRRFSLLPPPTDGHLGLSTGVIYEDSRGGLWFGSAAGASYFDGLLWSTLDGRDGLAADAVSTIVEDAQGACRPRRCYDATVSWTPLPFPNPLLAVVIHHLSAY